ncbi:MAG: thioredoxin-dependent thiol peroxidase [Chitinophagaceae bacterium]|nr:thioredoxin-dependent thiol peroxidase [Chitinophagaceae bacterium]
MTLNIGDKAPNFEGKNQDGKVITLTDYKGKKLVMFFYPKDNTPGCTEEACNLRDNIGALHKAGFEILGISSDDEKSHTKFIKKHTLPFDLIADTHKIIHEAYGVWGEKLMFGRKYMGTLRTTFLIDEKGKISDIIKKVNTKDHTSQIIS